MKQLHSFDELRQIKDTKVYALVPLMAFIEVINELYVRLLRRLHQLMVLVSS